jgi:hypothetical protein
MNVPVDKHISSSCTFLMQQHPPGNTGAYRPHTDLLYAVPIQPSLQVPTCVMLLPMCAGRLLVPMSLSCCCLMWRSWQPHCSLWPAMIGG